MSDDLPKPPHCSKPGCINPPRSPTQRYCQTHHAEASRKYHRDWEGAMAALKRRLNGEDID